MQENQSANGFYKVLNPRTKEDGMRGQGDLFAISLQNASQKTGIPKDDTEYVYLPQMLSEHFQTRHMLQWGGCFGAAEEPRQPVLVTCNMGTQNVRTGRSTEPPTAHGEAVWQHQGCNVAAWKWGTPLVALMQHLSSPSWPWDVMTKGLGQILAWFLSSDSLGACTNGSWPTKFIQILSALFDPPDSGSPSLQDTPSWRIFSVLCNEMNHKLPQEQPALLMCIFNLSSILIYDNIDGTVPSQEWDD